jgi:hypothetical protein
LKFLADRAIGELSRPTTKADRQDFAMIVTLLAWDRSLLKQPDHLGSIHSLSTKMLTDQRRVHE